MDKTTMKDPTSPVFPIEIFEEIIRRIDVHPAGRNHHDSKKNLKSCSLVCRQWRHVSQRLLFHYISLSPKKPSSQDFIRRVVQGMEEASRFTRHIKYLRIGGGLGDPCFGAEFPRFAESLTRVQELQFAWVDAMRWDRLPRHECEAFIRLLWLPSLKTVSVSHVAGYFPLCISSFFGPNVETLNLQRARVMRIMTHTLRGNMKAQLAKFHNTFPDTNHESVIRLKHISLGWKEDITVLVDFASFRLNNFCLDSLQTFTIQREESPATRTIDIERFFELSPSLESLEVYPRIRRQTGGPGNIRSGQENSLASMSRFGGNLSFRILHLHRDRGSNAFFEWIIPYFRYSPNPGVITSIEIVDTWFLKINDRDIQRRQGPDFLSWSWWEMDEIISSRFRNLERMCLTLNVGESCWGGQQDDLLQWLDFPDAFLKLRTGGTLVIEKNIVPE